MQDSENNAPKTTVFAPKNSEKKLKYKISIGLGGREADNSVMKEKNFWEAEFICDNPDQVIWFSSLYTGMLYSTLDEKTTLTVQIKPFFV